MPCTKPYRLPVTYPGLGVVPGPSIIACVWYRAPPPLSMCLHVTSRDHAWLPRGCFFTDSHVRHGVTLGETMGATPTEPKGGR